MVNGAEAASRAFLALRRLAASAATPVGSGAGSSGAGAAVAMGAASASPRLRRAS